MTISAFHTSARRRILPILLSLLLLFSLFPLRASAKNDTLTETVDITATRQRQEGEGWVWSQTNKTMTFTNMSMDTTDDYGFRLPPNATVVLEGRNSIRASKVGIAGLMDLKFTGSGSLTVTADIGIKMATPDKAFTLTFIDGDITINASSIGILSEYPTFVMGDADLSITLTEDSGVAVQAKKVDLNHGSIVSNAPIVSDSTIDIGGCELDMTASSSVLVAKTGIKVSEKTKLYEMNSSHDWVDLEGYSGGLTLKTEPELSRKTSLLLGDAYGVIWDYVILAATTLLLVASIALPILHSQKKRRRKIAQVEQMRIERARLRREEKKAARKHRNQ